MLKVRHARTWRNYPRAIIDGVPDRTARASVVAALEGAGFAGLFSVGGVAWANHVVLPEARWPEWSADGARVQSWTWDKLQGEHAARTLFIELPPATHARVRLAATRRGETLRAWATRAVEAQLEGEEATA